MNSGSDNYLSMNRSVQEILEARSAASEDNKAISIEAPLRLGVAAAIAFPDGSMTASGLRREAARGRLVIERIAGKDYTTLANIERMRKLCRVEAKAQGSTCAGHAQASAAKPSGLSATGDAISPRDALEARLTKGRRKRAQQALADYIANKYRPTRKARDIEQIDIADVLSIYLDDCGDDQADRKKFEGRISRLNSFWGGRMLSDVSTATCKEYVKVRGNTGGARRDLEDLRAAIGHHASENLHRAIVNVWLPPKGAPRDRWLTRSEAARLLWALLASPRSSNAPSRAGERPKASHQQAAFATLGTLYSYRDLYRDACWRHCNCLTATRCRSLLCRS